MIVPTVFCHPFPLSGIHLGSRVGSCVTPMYDVEEMVRLKYTVGLTVAEYLQDVRHFGMDTRQKVGQVLLRSWRCGSPDSAKRDRGWHLIRNSVVDYDMH